MLVGPAGSVSQVGGWDGEVDVQRSGKGKAVAADPLAWPQPDQQKAQGQ